MVSGVVTGVAVDVAVDVAGETLVAAEDVAGVAVVEPCCAFLLEALLLAFLGTTTGLKMPSLLPTVNCWGIGAYFPGTGCAKPSDPAVCTSSFTVPSSG